MLINTSEKNFEEIIESVLLSINNKSFNVEVIIVN